MTIENLMKAVPPPAKPFQAFAGPWEPIETEIGTTLPQDYKEFARLYGQGYFMEFLGIDIPRSQNPNVRLEFKVRAVCSTLLALDELTYPLWPSPGGLLPFGQTDNGDYLFWLTHGAPADWGVVVWDRAFGAFEPLECDLTDFLAGLASGEILPKEFPDDLLPCDCMFKPHSA